MDNEQRDEQHSAEQSRRNDDHDVLRKERKTRGDVREGHLQAARAQAKAENTLAQDQNQAEPLPDDKEVR